MAQQITTAEQKEMIKEIIAIFTNDLNKAIADESEDRIECYEDLINIFQDALDTGVFTGNIWGTVEEEYEHQMSLV